MIKMLGKGAHGKVLLVYNEELKKYFAMKILKKIISKNIIKPNISKKKEKF